MPRVIKLKGNRERVAILKQYRSSYSGRKHCKDDEKKFFIDTSALFKRNIEEKGSQKTWIDTILMMCYDFIRRGLTLVMEGVSNDKREYREILDE